MEQTPEQTLTELLVLGEMAATPQSHANFKIAAFDALPALRSALERLSAYEEAVGEWAKAKQAYDEADADPLVSPKDFEAAFAVFDAAEARLRALQEK